MVHMGAPTAAISEHHEDDQTPKLSKLSFAKNLVKKHKTRSQIMEFNSVPNQQNSYGLLVQKT